MRTWVFILAALLLAGCADTGLPFGPRGGEADTPPVDPTQAAYVATEDDPALRGDAPETEEAEQSADEAPPEEISELPNVEAQPPDPNAAIRAACLKRGGIFGKAETGAYACISRTGDSNKSCTASTQCEGACLARSRSCSPVTPLLGCHEILTNNGSRATICTN